MLTKREAIRECKRFWKAVVKSGLDKHRFIYSNEERREWKSKGYRNDCPLCQYTWGSKKSSCYKSCPLVLQYEEHCIHMKYDTDPNFFYNTYVKGLKE